MRSLGLYIHIPFCDGKCHYCNFFSQKCDDAAMDRYTGHLKTAIESWGKKTDRIVDTVYFGGGTPSLLGHRRLIEILDTVKASYRVTDDAEITVEVNPSSTDAFDFAALRTAGFNRLSIGLQSAQENELEALSRRHSVTDAGKTVKSARDAGFRNISLDVMLAIPHQTMDSLHSTLDYCISQQVQHISAYIFKIEPETRFYRERDRIPFFDEDAQAAIYEEAVRYLDRHGYHQYEISNFCLPGMESRHNLKYWHDEEYLGFGPSAHSFIDGKRFYCDNSFDAFYADQITDEGTGGDPEEYIMLALRLTEGLRFADYEKRFGEPIGNELLSAAKQLEEQGLVNLTPSSLSLTTKGFLVSNSVIAYLCDYL